MTDPRDRTGVVPPRSFNLGLVGVALLAALIPMTLGMAASVWTSLELDAFVYGLFAAMALAVGLAVPLAIGTRQRRLWWVRYFRGVGTGLLVAFVLCWPVLLAAPLGFAHLRPGNDPGTVVTNWVGIVLMAALGIPAAALLFHALRHPYWRADTPRDQWGG